MSRLARRLLGKTRFYAPWKAIAQYPDYWWWIIRGQPERPPHLFKQKTVREYARRFGLRTLVETGTYYGEMVHALLDCFARIYTVELDATLVSLARRRFLSYPHVQVLEGDSQEVIPRLLEQIKEPGLFWLDAGYYGWDGRVGRSGRLTSELRAVLAHAVPGHVILMDDAHGLSGTGGAPTLAELKSEIERDFPGWKVDAAYNIVRIHRPQP
jgi:hypothetical protein